MWCSRDSRSPTLTWAPALLALSTLALGACQPVGDDACFLENDTAPTGVRIESGTRHTSAGEHIAYCLFIPNSASPAAPCPAVVISHGFARSKRFHADTARALAERGVIVLTPDLISLLGGEDARQRNIETLVDHVRWLRSRATDSGDPLFGLLDAERVALVGHSAGGAISIEATIELHAADEGIMALMLLDGVPWSRTLERSGALPELTFASVRSEPDGCNADGAIRDVLPRLSFATDDILVVGATHCDPESPTDFICGAVCGGSGGAEREVYQELIRAFVLEALSRSAGGAALGFDATVAALVADGRVVVSPVGE